MARNIPKSFCAPKSPERIFRLRRAKGLKFFSRCFGAWLLTVDLSLPMYTLFLVFLHYLPSFLPSYEPMYLPTYLPTSLHTYIPVYIRTYQLSYPHMYLHLPSNRRIHQQTYHVALRRHTPNVLFRHTNY